MKVINVHKRILSKPKQAVAEELSTLSKDNDSVWPKENWPAMKFKNGIKVGAKGGHEPIRYTVEKYDPSEIIQFRFSNPKGFHGIHKFELYEISNQETEIIHTIDMTTSGKATIGWIFAASSLHNALIEDGFDKLENNLCNKAKRTEWNIWVKFIRRLLAKKSKTK